MAIEVLNTSITVTPYKPGDLPVIEHMYTAIDNNTKDEIPCGYFIDQNKLYLPRGTSISKLESVTGEYAIYNKKSDDFENMSRQHSSFYDPKDADQEEAISFLVGRGQYDDLRESHQKSFSLPTGGGKMEPYSNLIPTPDGIMKMGELNIGDYVFDRRGKPTKILHIFEQGIKDIYEITFEDGRKSKCGLEHLWNVKIDNQKEWITVNTETIIKAIDNLQRVVIPSNRRVKYDINEYKVNFHKMNLMNLRNQRIKYGNKARDEFMKLLLSKFCKININNDRSFEFELFIHDRNKIKDIKYVLWSLGLRCSFNRFNNLTITHGEIARMMKFFTNKRKLVKDLLDKGFYFKKNIELEIVDIKYVGKEQARCIMVDNDEHLYLTQDFIVTHNTFCSIYAATELNVKTLIITHKENIKKQWINTLKNMFDYRSNEILEISGSDVMERIMDDKIDPKDIYLINHQTLHSYLSRHNPYLLHEFFKKIKVGIKIYDEAHLEFNNILLMDSFSNTDKTWYVTATFARSDKSEDKCFKRAFNNVIGFGSHLQEKKRKHTIYHSCKVISQIDIKTLRRLLGWRGLTGNTYSKFALIDDNNDTVYKALYKVIDMVKDLNGKKLIFVGLIEAADNITEKLKRDFPEYRSDIGTFHSKISKEEKEDMLKKNIIVTTIKSCGVGTDIPGLRVLINTEAFASKVLAQQLIGRLREIDEETDTYLFDIWIGDIPASQYWHRARSKKLSELSKDTIYLDLQH